MEAVYSLINETIIKLSQLVLPWDMSFQDTFCLLSRVIFPVLTIAIVVRCGVSLLKWPKEPEVWAYLTLPNGGRIPVKHWENLMGRAKRSDILLNYPTVSRNHGVLTRRDDGVWTITVIKGNTNPVLVNSEVVEESEELRYGDVLTMGGVDMTLIPVPEDEKVEDAAYRTKPGKSIKPSVTFLMITLLQILSAVQLTLSKLPHSEPKIAVVFLALAVMMWLYFIIIRCLRRTGFEIESIAFLLTTFGLSVIASDNPDELYKQLICVFGGIIIFLALGIFMRDLQRTKKVRWYMAAIGIGLFAINLVFGTEVYGAKNWIMIGGFSIQPSELIKICFIFAGASTLDRLVTRRNLYLFIAFAGVCCGSLALMNDFGTAIVYFATFVVIAFLRSGDFATISLITASVGFGGVLALKLKPHALSRFQSWRHIWEAPYDAGYQQTRALMSVASGGLLGLGAGNGWLKNVAASDTDLVFCFLAEELGLLVALACVICIVLLAVFTIRAASVGRSSFYVIAGCSAMCMLLIQTMLNVFGSVDILPFTGVTFPFVSNGGSSMLASWGLLAFVKAADTRQNASFAIRLHPDDEGAEGFVINQKEAVE
ncbi:MAG: FHA domain-containing protein [Ruminococcaceae bacterium]|nr:FHA domain-containing protein [Oscillospiraceae bacterium]